MMADVQFAIIGCARLLKVKALAPDMWPAGIVLWNETAVARIWYLLGTRSSPGCWSSRLRIGQMV